MKQAVLILVFLTLAGVLQGKSTNNEHSVALENMNRNNRILRQENIKQIRKKNRKSERNIWRNKDRQAVCEEGVTNQCLEDARDVLFFEAYQRNNFLKQFTRYVNQNRTSGNKFEKRGNFDGPRKWMEQTAGGNISDVTCESNTTFTHFMANYTLLSNCSKKVAEKCNISGPDPTELSAMVNCNQEMKKTKAITADCQNKTTDGTAQCACWASAKTDHVDMIRNLRPKCTGMSKIAKEMKKARNACLSQFTDCKRAEDSAVRLIEACMFFQTQNLNQTHLSLQAGAEILG